MVDSLQRHDQHMRALILGDIPAFCIEMPRSLERGRFAYERPSTPTSRGQSRTSPPSKHSSRKYQFGQHALKVAETPDTVFLPTHFPFIPFARATDAQSSHSTEPSRRWYRAPITLNSGDRLSTISLLTISTPCLTLSSEAARSSVSSPMATLISSVMEVT